jgi:FkbM family methyltransferase
VPELVGNTLKRIRRNSRARAVAGRIPGLKPAYHELRKQVIVRRGVGRLDYDRAPVRIRTSSRRAVEMRLYPVSKEPWTVEWIEGNVGDGDVVYDIGANVGAYSLIAATVGGPATRVVAIEPGYANYAALCDNIILNGFGATIVPLPAVVGAIRHLGTLSYRDTAAGAALHELDASDEGVYRQPVLVHTLDDLIDDFDLPQPTLIKLDVDGAEALVLSGAQRTLAGLQLRSLIVEIEDPLTEAVCSELDRAGFGIVERFDARDGTPLPGVWYGIFARA